MLNPSHPPSDPHGSRGDDDGPRVKIQRRLRGELNDLQPSSKQLLAVLLIKCAAAAWPPLACFSVNAHALSHAQCGLLFIGQHARTHCLQNHSYTHSLLANHTPHTHSTACCCGSCSRASTPSAASPARCWATRLLTSSGGPSSQRAAPSTTSCSPAGVCVWGGEVWVGC